MAKSPLVLNTENPITSSRIKYAHTSAHTHTHTRLTHVETLSNQNTSPRIAGGKGGGTPAPGLPRAPSARAAGTAAGAGAPWDDPKMQRFIFKPQEKQAGAGEGKSKRHPSGRGNGEEEKQRAALSALPSDTRKSDRRSPHGCCRPGGSGRQPAPSAGTPAPRPRHARSAPSRGRRAAETPERCRGSAGPRAGGGTERLLCRCPSCPRAARTLAGGAGVSGRDCHPCVFPCRSLRRGPRGQKRCFLTASGQAAAGSGAGPRRGRRPAERPGGRQRDLAAGRAVSRTAGGPAAPGCRRGAARAPRFRRTGSGREAQAGTMRRQPSRLAPVLGLTPAALVKLSRRAVRAKRQGISPGQRQKVRLGVEKVTPAARKSSLSFAIKLA